jgi:aryl-phospho-beta-D-glucosidase BglC (GH1 family)
MNQACCRKSILALPGVGVLVLAILYASFTHRSSPFADATYNRSVKCVLRPNQPADAIASALGYACGVINCSPIQPGGAHYEPNTLEDHFAWAAQEYYDRFQYLQSIHTCDFGGVAMLQCGQNNASGLTRPRIIGVNLGGFLVLEPWITPSLFTQFMDQPPNRTAIDEYTFSLVLGQEEAEKQLSAHWNQWVTEDDIATLANVIGVTHLRIPFGYWIFGDVPPFVRGIEQLDRVLDLAAKYRLQVLLDLHGGVGSQNGFDNSGRACNITHPEKKSCIVPCPAHAEWGRDLNGSTVNQTIVTLERIAARYSNHSAVWGVELINEPRLVNISVLKDFYMRGYAAVRNIAPNWAIVIHDGFYPLSWGNFMTPALGYTNVYLDTHIYEAFGPDANATYDGHLQEACGYTKNINYMECIQLPLLVAEWSLATDDCDQWLNGVGQKPLSNLCPVRPPNAPFNTTFLAQYAINQVSAFFRGHGFFFWNFKTERNPQWSLLDAYSADWLPSFSQPLESSVVEACGYSEMV